MASLSVGIPFSDRSVKNRALGCFGMAGALEFRTQRRKIRDIRANQRSHSLDRLNMVLPEVRRQEPAFALSERKREVIRAENSFAGERNDQVEMRGIHHNGEGIGRLPSFCSKVAARSEEPTVTLLGGQRKRRSPADCRAAKIRDRER